METIIRVIFVLILIGCGKIRGCLCPPQESTKSFFCKQDIVFQGRVLSTVELPRTESLHDDVIMYKVKVEKMFRGYLGREVWLTSSKSSSLCGVHLEENIPYLLTTSWVKTLFLCGWNTPITSLTEDDLYVINRKTDCET